MLAVVAHQITVVVFMLVVLVVAELVVQMVQMEGQT
jgi:hypothetical protein